MQALSTIRGWQFDALHRSVKTIGFLLAKTSAEDMRTLRDGGDGWTVLEVMCHLRDWEELFLDRVKLMKDTELPDLPNPDPDAAAAERGYLEQSLQGAYESWAKNRANFVKYLETLTEADWDRAGQHPRRGLMSIADQLFLTVWHDSLHIEQMIKILNQR
jgi:uncharacterized damage-inducible protein DinB